MDPASGAVVLPFPFVPTRVPLALMWTTNSASGSRELIPVRAQDATTVADRIDSSARLWWRFETVSPPNEKARSASAEDAIENLI